MKSIGLKNLEAYSVESGRFFQRITPGALPAEAVADDLRIHIETLVGAINSLKAALIKGGDRGFGQIRRVHGPRASADTEGPGAGRTRRSHYGRLTPCAGGGGTGSGGRILRT